MLDGAILCTAEIEADEPLVLSIQRRRYPFALNRRLREEIM